MTPADAIAQIEAAAQPGKAAEMAAYHKVDRRYLGTSVPEIDALAKAWRADLALEDRLALAAFIALIWAFNAPRQGWEAIGAALTAAGFDAGDLFARAQTDAVKQGLVANTDAVVARGAFGIPTMFVGPKGEGEMFFGKERLGQIEELLAKG